MDTLQKPVVLFEPSPAACQRFSQESCQNPEQHRASLFDGGQTQPEPAETQQPSGGDKAQSVLGDVRDVGPWVPRFFAVLNINFRRAYIR